MRDIGKQKMNSFYRIHTGKGTWGRMYVGYDTTATPVEFPLEVDFSFGRYYYNFLYGDKKWLDTVLEAIEVADDSKIFFDRSEMVVQWFDNRSRYDRKKRKWIGKWVPLSTKEKMESLGELL